MSSNTFLRNDHCIAYAQRSWHNRKSAVIFQNTFILAPASIVFGCLSAKAIKMVSRHLATFTLLDATNGNVAANDSQVTKELRSLRFRIVHKRNPELIATDAELCYLFNCRGVSESVDNLLDNFEPLLVERKKEETAADLSPFLMSSFVILRLVDRCAVNNEELVDVLSQVSRQEDSKSVERVIRFDVVRKLDDVAIVSTPFTNEVFFGTVNVGKVANIFGNNDCLFVASATLVGGCEGGAVFNRRMNVVGIVICTSFLWKNSQHAALTLVASFSEVLNEFLRQSSFNHFRIERSLSSSSSSFNQQMEKSVLFIKIGAAGGTGCLLKIADFRFVLTCSHVVFDSSPTSPIMCYWSCGSFPSQIIFKNPNYAKAYDLALLTVPAKIPDEYFTECQSSRPVVGDVVYATGFPHFFALAQQRFAPSVFEGRITKIEHGLLFTDASVQAGQSGGPLFNATGQLTGVMVSNSQDTKTNQIYPNTNMCVPVFDIYSTLDAFATSRDLKALAGLLAEQSIVQRWDLQPDLPKVISKL